MKGRNLIQNSTVVLGDADVARAPRPRDRLVSQAHRKIGRYARRQWAGASSSLRFPTPRIPQAQIQEVAGRLRKLWTG